MDIYDKYSLLKENLRSMKSVAIAFSGGVDSTFLLKVAFDVLGDKAIAITAKSPGFSKRESKEALEFTKNNGIKNIIIKLDELIDEFYKNPVDRCYHCKKYLFEKIISIAKKENISNVLDGSNIDDLRDYRPGLKAIEELEISSPLKDAFMTKGDIRKLSHELNLSTWDKPAFACLATRFPYGELITKEKLEMVDKAEGILFEMGFKQVRVRCHKDIARIEVENTDFERLMDKEVRNDVSHRIKRLGFRYCTIDMDGYKMGNLNPE